MHHEISGLFASREMGQKFREKYTKISSPAGRRVLECNNDFYKNAVRLYKMYRRADKFSNRVSQAPKYGVKPPECAKHNPVKDEC